jgi:hypothetical protein
LPIELKYTLQCSPTWLHQEIEKQNGGCDLIHIVVPILTITCWEPFNAKYISIINWKLVNFNPPHYVPSPLTHINLLLKTMDNQRTVDNIKRKALMEGILF